jgi:hypothetical protein
MESPFCLLALSIGKPMLLLCCSDQEHLDVFKGVILSCSLKVVVLLSPDVLPFLLMKIGIVAQA